MIFDGLVREKAREAIRERAAEFLNASNRWVESADKLTDAINELNATLKELMKQQQQQQQQQQPSPPQLLSDKQIKSLNKGLKKLAESTDHVSMTFKDFINQLNSFING
ncbi:MAG: hypothetical protein QXQ68_06000 [Candidatus Nitrosocaldaceae archaeon]